MQTEKEKSNIFTLLAQWSELLPQKGENEPNKLATFNKLGGEIDRLCSQFESPIKKEIVETDFKPSFIFQLTTDQTINPSQLKFPSVFDFCEKLSEHCESTNHLNIETDWLKLLLACSSHNYDRFMWIHLTFQASNNLRLNWYGVRKRLMCKFDDPNRRMNVLNQITNFKYIPEVESIHMANKRFLRLVEEAEIDAIHFYVNGLPESIKNVIHSTIDYDATTNFHCDLKDVMQRATVFLCATDDEFIFYSKTAHLAVSLEHQKVDQKDCEFHLLAEHSTSNCPDYTIVKYPYMEFTPLILPVASSPHQTIPTAPASDLLKMNHSPVIIKKEVPDEIEHQSVKDLARRVLLDSNQSLQAEEDVNGLTKLQVLDKASRLSLSGIPLPENLKARLEQMKEQNLEEKITSVNRQDHHNKRTRSRSPDERSYRERSESPETGCYIHGKHASHRTKDCRMAQMVIPPRKSSRRSSSPSGSRKNRYRKNASGVDNPCIFCQLPFKPGHLGTCKKVPPKRRK